jgi:hypothetical protein
VRLSVIKEELIAAGGMNCGICMAYLRKKEDVWAVVVMILIIVLPESNASSRIV